MVSFDPEERSRAQLILVGAVAVAFIVMGLVVVFNTVLYTENVASTGSVSEPREAQRTNQVLRSGSKGMVARVNADAKWNDSSDSSELGDVRDAVLANLTTYSEGFLNVTADRRPGFVNVSEGDSSKMKFAARLADTEGNGFEDTNGATEWEVTDGNKGVLVRDFNMTVKVGTLADEGTGNEFQLLWNETDDAENYSVWVYEKGDGDVAIRTLATASAADNPEDFSAGTECVLQNSASNATVNVSLATGDVEGYNCPNLDLRSQVGADEFATLEFDNAGEVAGSYAVILWRDEPDPDDYVSSLGVKNPSTIVTGGAILGDQPYWSYAVWEMELEATYESSDTTFTDTYVIEVYNSTA